MFLSFSKASNQAPGWNGVRSPTGCLRGASDPRPLDPYHSSRAHTGGLWRTRILFAGHVLQPRVPARVDHILAHPAEP